ncbi:MAG: hypothetical protein Q8M92_02385 [Candidatus Subteraquimicrobiales bacterium]|nr:hypothetical protein [Candidatus Subteraquimicrobiales bacterium]
MQNDTQYPQAIGTREDKRRDKRQGKGNAWAKERGYPYSQRLSDIP